VLLDRYHFDEEHTIELYDLDATRANIVSSLRTLAGKVAEEDSLVIYFAGPVDVDIDMKYKYEDFLFKINPFFKNYNNAEESAVFFVFGRGDVKYLDKKGDGWKGNSTIYGIEIVDIEKKFSTCIGLKVKNINFDRGTMLVLTGKKKYSATSILIDFSFAFGVGI